MLEPDNSVQVAAQSELVGIVRIEGRNTVDYIAVEQREVPAAEIVQAECKAGKLGFAGLRLHLSRLDMIYIRCYYIAA